MPLDDRVTARLLSGRDEPSVLEHEAIFEAVMQELKVGPARAPSPWACAPALLAASAALFLLLSLRTTDGPRHALVARGAGAQGTFEVSCMDARGTPRACAAGMKVGIEVHAPPGRPFFALLARRPDGALVWYPPKPGEPMPRVNERDASEPWPEAPWLTTDTLPGLHTWLAIFAEHSLNREQLKHALGDDLRGESTVTVIVRSLTVEAAP